MTDPTILGTSTPSSIDGRTSRPRRRTPGEVVLVVNTASKCGLTPQYEGLQELYDDYADQGLIVLGFPCDQFGHQEPGTEEEISGFCESQLRRHLPDVRQDRRERRRHPSRSTSGSRTKAAC